MLASKNIDWSSENYSLIDLLHSSHSSEYPLLVKVFKGHATKTKVDSHDPGQTFVFYGSGTQERVLARNTDTIPISIPRSHEHKLSMYVCKDKENRQRVLLPLSSIVSCYSPPVRAEFDPSVTSIFYVGDTFYCSNDFGPMMLESTHLLEYVKCSPISQAGELHDDALHVLHTSLSLTCVVARSLWYGLNLGKGLRRVQQDASVLMDAAVDQKLPGICGYSDLVPQKGGNYELIEDKPAGPWGSRLGFKSPGRDQTSIHHSSATAQDLPGPQIPVTSPILNNIGNNVSVEDEGYMLPLPTKNGHGHGGLPAKVLTLAPSIGCDIMKELKEKLKENTPGNENMVKGGSAKTLTIAVTRPLPGNTSPLHSYLPSQPRDKLQPPPTPMKPFVPSTDDAQNSPYVIKMDHQDVPGRSERLDDAKNSPSMIMMDHQDAAATLMHTNAHKPVPTQALSQRFSSLEDVPKDISSLSVQDVSYCLSLLKLDIYAQQFTDNLVDGRLLLACTASDLESEFGFTKVRARQVERFAKEGWRPKIDG